jgi:NAD(P)-dependent dehydrogenase (short-subunit alcohol dehydrogenase family)
MSLEIRRAIVTGATSGIGAAVARLLLREGWSVVGVGRSRERWRALVADLDSQQAAKAMFLQADIANRGEVFEMVAAAVNHLGGLDGVVHAAGVERSCPAEQIDDELWDMLFDTNARGTMLVNQAAFPHLQERGGRIVNFASSAGIIGLVGSSAYAASKGAVIAWTRSIAQEWAKYAITVNCIAPAIWTPMYDAHRSRLEGEALDLHLAKMRQIIPLGGQHGDADRDLAPYVSFLLSASAGFITGQTLAVDGGMVMMR